jgi:hypothetical protein
VKREAREVQFDTAFDANVFRNICLAGNINMHSELGIALHNVAVYGDAIRVTVKRLPPRKGRKKGEQR